ncbi:MAG TPA: polysaccharide biosynthesis tyrosine autokinase [Bryobacteraceae bacterium]|nr:polysaccharide biosynthesis tyrosine autokinase [Bryobacteraceae bacterium]
MERKQEDHNRAWYDRELALEPLQPRGGSLARPGDIPNFDLSRNTNGEDRIRYFVLLRRYRLAVLSIIGGCLVAAAIYTVLASKVYKAQTVLEVMTVNQDFMNNKNVDPTSQLSGSDTYLDTQSKLLLSGPVIDKTAELLAPAVPSSLTTKRSFFAPILGLFGLSQTSIVNPESIVRKMLSKAKVKVEGQSSLIDLTVQGPAPQLTADAANTLANQYRSQTQQARWDTAAQTGEFLMTQLEGFRKKLLASEDELQNYARATGLVYASDANHESVATDKLRQIQMDLAKAEADRTQKQAQLELVQSAAPETVSQVTGDAESRTLKAKLDDLKRQDVELRATLTPAHYKVQRVEMQIKELQAQLAQTHSQITKQIRNDYDEADRRAQLEEAAYNKQLALVSDQNIKEVKYNMLKHEVDANRQIYQSMLQRVNEANVMTALRASNVRVVSPAKPPVAPSLPSWAIDLGIGFLLGCVGSLLYILLRERTDRSVRMPGESLMIVDVPELAVIPSAKLDPRSPIPFGKRAAARLHPGTNSLTAGKPANLLEMPATPGMKWGELDSLIAESFRSAVTSILLAGRSESGQRVIVVTSAHPQAGKTTAVFSLGLGLAESGRKVLLIDGDLRRPRLGQIFGVQDSDGLSNILTSDAKDNDVKNLVRPTGIPGLSILPSGAMPQNVARALHSMRLDDVLKLMREEYDFVLVDSPPMIPLTDARLLGQHADGVILICRSGQTTMDQLVTTRRRLAEDGIHVMGTILNDWNAYSEDPSYLNSYAEYARPLRP